MIRRTVRSRGSVFIEMSVDVVHMEEGDVLKERREEGEEGRWVRSTSSSPNKDDGSEAHIVSILVPVSFG